MFLCCRNFMNMWGAPDLFHDPDEHYWWLVPRSSCASVSCESPHPPQLWCPPTCLCTQEAFTSHLTSAWSAGDAVFHFLVRVGTWFPMELRGLEQVSVSILQRRGLGWARCGAAATLATEGCMYMGAGQLRAPESTERSEGCSPAHSSPIMYNWGSVLWLAVCLIFPHLLGSSLRAETLFFTPAFTVICRVAEWGKGTGFVIKS